MKYPLALTVIAASMATAAVAAPQAQPPVAAEPATPATPAQPADPTAPAQAATPAAPANTVAAVVDAEFPTYDASQDGQLDKAEFGKWISALRDKAAETGQVKKLDAPGRQKLIDKAFAAADTDKSGTVSKDEMTTMLNNQAK